LKEEKQLYQREHAYEIEEAMGLIDDMNQAFSPCLYMAMRPQVLGYEEGFQKTEEGKAIVEKIRNKFCTEDLPMFLDFLTGLLEKSGGGWLAPGDKPSIADCLAIPNVRRFSRGFIDHVPANCLNSHPKVVEWIERFCNLPEIKGRYNDGIGATKQGDA
jgi:glutathione S-transferase